MQILEVATALVFIALVLLMIFEPKLDWNYETEWRMLWINNPFGRGRICFPLYKGKVKS